MEAVFQVERARMRFWANLLGALGMLLAMIVAAQAQLYYDRQGGDYLSFAIRSGDPAVCASRCERDGRCRAWSFSYPRTKSVLATCRLKKSVPPRVEDDCCVTGVRGAGVVLPRHGGIEYGIDRAGGDYRSFNTAADPAGSACKAACNAEHRCRAWTYMRPGYGSAGAFARCYLKAKIPRPRHRPCCISGVVR
jgi:PAN domain